MYSYPIDHQFVVVGVLAAFTAPLVPPGLGHPAAGDFNHHGCDINIVAGPGRKTCTSLAKCRQISCTLMGHRLFAQYAYDGPRLIQHVLKKGRISGVKQMRPPCTKASILMGLQKFSFHVYTRNITDLVSLEGVNTFILLNKFFCQSRSNGLQVYFLFNLGLIIEKWYID